MCGITWHISNVSVMEKCFVKAKWVLSHDICISDVWLVKN